MVSAEGGEIIGGLNQPRTTSAMPFTKAVMILTVALALGCDKSPGVPPSKTAAPNPAAAIGAGVPTSLAAPSLPGVQPWEPVDPETIQDLYAHAVAVGQEIRRLLPTNAQAIFDQGKTHQRFQFDDKAVETFREGLRLDPKRVDILQEIGFLLSQRYQDQALEAYHAALELDPTASGLRTRIGLILSAQGKIDEAILSLRDEIGRRSSTGLTYLILGQALLDQKKFEEAAKSLRESIRLEAKDRKAHYALAQALQALGQTAEEAQARAEFVKIKTEEDRASKEAATKGSNRPELLHKAAVSYVDAATTCQGSSRLREAEGLLRNALRFDPKYGSVRRVLADHLRRERRPDEAWAVCVQGIEESTDPDLYYLLAGLTQERGDPAGSAPLLEKALALDPRHADSARELARLILLRKVPGTAERALTLSTAAADVAPGVAMNHDVLAWAYLTNGDPNRALESLRTAVKLEPQNQDIRRRLDALEKKLGIPPGSETGKGL